MTDAHGHVHGSDGLSPIEARRCTGQHPYPPEVQAAVQAVAEELPERLHVDLPEVCSAVLDWVRRTPDWDSPLEGAPTPAEDAAMWLAGWSRFAPYAEGESWRVLLTGRQHVDNAERRALVHTDDPEGRRQVRAAAAYLRRVLDDTASQAAHPGPDRP
jgi:hypothetical protein